MILEESGSPSTGNGSRKNGRNPLPEFYLAKVLTRLTLAKVDQETKDAVGEDWLLSGLWRLAFYGATSLKGGTVGSETQNTVSQTFQGCLRNHKERKDEKIEVGLGPPAGACLCEKERLMGGMPEKWAHQLPERVWNAWRLFRRRKSLGGAWLGGPEKHRGAATLQMGAAWYERQKNNKG